MTTTEALKAAYHACERLKRSNDEETAENAENAAGMLAILIGRLAGSCKQCVFFYHDKQRGFDTCITREHGRRILFNLPRCRTECKLFKRKKGGEA